MKIQRAGMKDYVVHLLFGGARYYASGGVDDFGGAFPTLRDALDAARAQGWDEDTNWYHVAVWAGEKFTIVRAGP